MIRCPNCGSSNTKERDPKNIPSTIDCTACKLFFVCTPSGIFADPNQPAINPGLRKKMLAKYEAAGYKT